MKSWPLGRWIVGTIAAVMLASCGSSGSAQKPPPPVPEEEPPETIGLDEVLAEPDEEGMAIAQVLTGDTSEMSRKLAAAMGGEGAEFVIPKGAPDEPAKDEPANGPPKRHGSMLLGAPQVTDGCDAKAVDRVLRHRAGMLRACYEQRLQVVDGLAGKVDLDMTIDPDGGVTHAKAVGLGDGEATACIERGVRRTRFGAIGPGCTARVTLTFAPVP